jgi:hypothetical protein
MENIFVTEKSRRTNIGEALFVELAKVSSIIYFSFATYKI